VEELSVASQYLSGDWVSPGVYIAGLCVCLKINLGYFQYESTVSAFSVILISSTYSHFG